MDESNMKVINDFIVQGTLIGYQRRSHATDDAFSPDIIVNCDDNEYDECDTMCESTINVFNNINTDLLLSLDYYEMDSFGRLPGKSIHFIFIFISFLFFKLSTILVSFFDSCYFNFYYRYYRRQQNANSKSIIVGKSRDIFQCTIAITYTDTNLSGRSRWLPAIKHSSTITQHTNNHSC